ncbi:MAG TPA: hypothetical protein VNN08_25535, partial [Thermoanaerobaculia bacterium]|nr:hypothetical protein [Thermoanaerobaculia bacterium]
MNDGGMEQLPDWARDVIRTIAVPAVQPSVCDHRGGPAWPLFVDAAVVGAFLPSELFPQMLSGNERKAAEKELLRFAEVTQQPEGARWSLTRDARHAVLVSCDPKEIADAAERTLARVGDPLAVALRDCLQGRRGRDLASMIAQELEATRIAITWLQGVGELELPSLQDIDRHIALQRLLAPFERMVGKSRAHDTARPDRFFGRGDEMEDLRAYVGVVAADSVGNALRRVAKRVQRIFTGRQPKVVWGTGGVGKTTLIAKFMLEQARSAPSRFPFAYLDFDRSTISARNRPGLLAEICYQVGAQFERLTQPMTALRDRFADLACKVDLNSEADSIGALLAPAAEFRRLINEVFPSPSFPFLLVFDTFEIVQYGPDQVVALEKLVSALTGGDADAWPRLRLIISGRQRVRQFLGPVEELELGALDRDGSVEMLAALASDAGKPITDHEALRLVQALGRHVRDRSNTGVRPLRLRLIGELFKEREESGGAVVETLLDDLAKSAGEQSAVGRAFVDGILVRRILGHVKDRRVYALTDPGLVVRRITTEVIREVMTRGTQRPGAGESGPIDPKEIEPWVVDDAEAAEIFAAFRRDVSLVDPEGDALRHREDVRQDMLPLIQAHRPRGFLRIHRLAFDHFRAKAAADHNDTFSAAEAIYHGLWLRKPCEELERLWPQGKAFDPRIDPDEFEQSSLENIYLRAKKGARLGSEEIRRLPPAIAVDWLASRSDELVSQQRLDAVVAEVRSVGGDDYAALDDNHFAAATVSRVLYRAGLWREAAALLRRHLQTSLQVPRKGESISIIRTWATILAKSGAEPEQLASLVPHADRIRDPLVRSEVFAHICLGLDDAPVRDRIRDAARERVGDSARLVRPAQWQREFRILRLVLATRCRGFERLARMYLSESERLPRDPTVFAILSRWLNQSVDEQSFDQTWNEARAMLLRAD